MAPALLIADMVSGALARGAGSKGRMTRNNGEKPDAVQNFWEKPLDRLTRAEWERLCDGCGRCCLVKLENEDTGTIHHTSVACKLLDQQSCRCGDYPGRKKIVPDCVRLTAKKLATIDWLPPSCAYRLRAEDKPLPDWHPLISGDADSVHRSGASVRGRVEASEADVPLDDLVDFIRLWPKRWPKKPRR